MHQIIKLHNFLSLVCFLCVNFNFLGASTLECAFSQFQTFIAESVETVDENYDRYCGNLP